MKGKKKNETFSEDSTGVNSAEETAEKVAETANAASEKVRSGRQHEQKLKFSFREQKEFETIEDDIAALEERIETIEAEMNANATNSARLTELSAEAEKSRTQLEAKMERWMYLTELAERIDAQT